ncbi:hypothetical protein GW17_00016523 [Ensete ventricosum]|nr:hypothetical protein GW17_00016523 [Ensete ventricosum]
MGFWWLSINRRGDSWLIGCSFSHHLLFSSLPLSKSCKIRLEEFRFFVLIYAAHVMHPLRFPNSGIRAKGRPHACSLHAEVAGHGQAPYRGGRPWPSYMQGVVGYGQARCKGRSPAGAAARKRRPPAGTVGYGQPTRASRQRPSCKGLPPRASPASSRGDGAGRRGARPLAGRLPVAKGSRHLRRGSDVVRVKEG